MDQMLPSPNFSIPSIGTPLHHPDEDQQILPSAQQAQQTSSISSVQDAPMDGDLMGVGGLPMGMPMTEDSFGVVDMDVPLAPAPDSKAEATPSNSLCPMSPMTPLTDPGIVPQLQNIVSTVSLGCKLDLKNIAVQARNAEYNPQAVCSGHHANQVRSVG